MFRILALTISLLLPLAGSGCAIVEIGMRNPIVGLETVAIAPFFNLSQERSVDGREFALAYYSELQKVPGFEVLPVGVTERAMVENGISLSGPEDAIRLAKILDVDAVVVGAVTDYDPYNPRIGLKVAWYSPRQWLFLPNEDSQASFFHHSTDGSTRRPGRPKYGNPRAQSPDNSDDWLSANSRRTTKIEDGNWEPITAAPELNPDDLRLSDAAFSQTHASLPDNASLLVPVEAVRTTAKAWPAALPMPAAKPVRSGIHETTSHLETVPYPVPVPPAEPAPPANTEKVIPVQAVGPVPPVEFQPSPADQPITPSNAAATAGQPASSDPSLDNLFNRHLSTTQPKSVQGDTPNPLVPEIADRPGSLHLSRLAAAQPEIPSDGDPIFQPPSSMAAPSPPDRSSMLPVMTTPLFPPQPSESEVSSMPGPRSTVPGLVYDEQVVMAPTEFDPNEPLMAYVRLFDATDRRLIARLSDYLELTGQLRSGNLEAYMKRSEFFRKFTAHVMISEMLSLHGGEARRQLVLKPRKYR
ncbi:MAG: hypothetical protein O3B13_07940 [Planctomycetota bacterium]|nr:hypothetical protein [Planctomycetota bacterium]